MKVSRIDRKQGIIESRSVYIKSFVLFSSRHHDNSHGCLKRGTGSNRNLDLPVQFLVPGMFIFKRDTLMELLFQDVTPLPAFHKITRLAYTKKRRAFPFVFGRRTTTYKELWLAAENPKSLHLLPSTRKTFRRASLSFSLFLIATISLSSRIIESNVSESIIYVYDAIMLEAS